MEETLERIYTIPLRKVKWSSRNGQADRAIRAIRHYLTKHMKAEEVWIDAAVNHHIWSRGKFKVPSKIRIRARLFDDGVCEVSLPEEETTAGESMREQLVEAREKKLEEVHKGEIEAAERAAAEGAATPSGLTRPAEAEEAEEEAPAARKEAEEEEKPAPKPVKKAAEKKEEPKAEKAEAKPKAPKKEEPKAEAKPEAPKKESESKKESSGDESEEASETDEREAKD